MDNDIKTVILHMDENLEGFNKELEFSYTDENFSFNISGNEYGQGASRATYDVTTRACTFETLEGVDDEVNEEIVATFIGSDIDYLVVTSDYTAIPLSEGFNVNCIASHNMDLLQPPHIEEINKKSICLTTISDLGMKYGDITATIILLDFSELSSRATASMSMFELAAEIQKNGNDGVAAINSYLYSVYENALEVRSVDENIVEHEAVEIVDDTQPESEELDSSPAPDKLPAAAKSEILSIPLTKLIADSRYQFRAAEDTSAIKDLVVAYQEDRDSVPAIEVIYTGDKYIIVDGFHRFAAAEKAGLDSLDCEVTTGTERDAFTRSLGANANNRALKRTNLDKRKAVEAAISDEIFKDLSCRDIALICKVSHTIVNRIQNELSESVNVYTEENYKPESNNADDVTTTAKTQSNDKQAHSTTSATKPTRETISSKYITLSISIKQHAGLDSYDELKADLNAVIVAYELELDKGETM